MKCGCDPRAGKMQSGIEISIVYTHVHLIELQISASNVAFAAQVNTYVNHEVPTRFAKELKGFPAGVDDVRRIEVGANTNFTFSMVDGLGHSIVAVAIADDVVGPNSLTGKAAFNILVNPAEIDEFVAQLATFTSEVGQSALLKGL